MTHRLVNPGTGGACRRVVCWVAVGITTAGLASTRLSAEPLSIEPRILAAIRFGSPALPVDWTFDREGVWAVRQGRLHARLPDRKQDKSLAYFGSANWKNYVVDLDVLQIRGADKGIVVRVDGRDGIGVDLRGSGYDDVVMYRGFSQLGKAAAPNPDGQWHHLRVEVRDNRYRVHVNGALTIDYVDEGRRNPAGRLALAAYSGGVGECEVAYDNVVVRQLP